MALWMALLKGVPWAGVISSAPVVVDGAKQLWKAVSRKPAPAAAPPARPRVMDADATPTEQRLNAMEAQTSELGTAVGELHTQMLKSSELIAELADQNAALIRHVDALRRRGRWLAVASVLAVLLAAVALATRVGG